VWVVRFPGNLSFFKSAGAVPPVIAMNFKGLTDEFCAISVVVGSVNEFEECAETILPGVFSWDRVLSAAITEEKIAKFHGASPYSMCS